MRIVFYNIRYGTGSGWYYHFPLPFTGFFRRSSVRIRRISDFLDSLHPDIVCLMEVDGGSYRHRRRCQAGHIASVRGWEHSFSGKYGSSSILNYIPILSSHGNAVLSGLPILSSRELHFPRGIKKTFLDVEFNNFHVILAHLSLGRQARKSQLDYLARHCNTLSKPVMLGGDLNLFHGSSEIEPFMRSTGFKTWDHLERPTFPSRTPRLKLDYLLTGRGLNVKKIDIPGIRLSDHLPLVCDFNVDKNN